MHRHASQWHLPVSLDCATLVAEEKPMLGTEPSEPSELQTLNRVKRLAACEMTNGNFAGSRCARRTESIVLAVKSRSVRVEVIHTSVISVIGDWGG